MNEGAFSGLRYLIDLDLGYNRISSISNGIWTGLGKLEKLHLLNNQISRISSGTFQGLSNLKLLDLGQNHILILEKGAFSGLESLHELILKRNYMTTLDQEIFRVLPRPLLMTLSSPHPHIDHPWNCLSLCWLRNEEVQGTLFFHKDFHPRCIGGIEWRDLACPSAGKVHVAGVHSQCPFLKVLVQSGRFVLQESMDLLTRKVWTLFNRCMSVSYHRQSSPPNTVNIVQKPSEKQK